MFCIVCPLVVTKVESGERAKKRLVAFKPAHKCFLSPPLPVTLTLPLTPPHPHPHVPSPPNPPPPKLPRPQPPSPQIPAPPQVRLTHTPLPRRARPLHFPPCALPAPDRLGDIHRRLRLRLQNERTAVLRHAGRGVAAARARSARHAAKVGTPAPTCDGCRQEGRGWEGDVRGPEGDVGCVPEAGSVGAGRADEGGGGQEGAGGDGEAGGVGGWAGLGWVGLGWL
ncbi:hypothetical protein M8818_005003 [Zalaria obscura]|uniref:Uncharacterized protein n=1 Tax=Zalaria obscura TaxID=2024903 RepID=A0ACC3SAM7_9PEZI